MEPQHQYEQSDTLMNFIVTLNSGESFCSNTKSLPVKSVKPFVPNFISPNDDGKNDVFEIKTDDLVELNIYNRWGKPIYHSENYLNDWDAEELGAGVYFYEIIFDDKNTRCNGWVQVMR